jgi:hypothetical protein
MSQDPAELPEADPEAAKVRQTARIWYIYLYRVYLYHHYHL